jgi:hypothetical protein
MSMFQLSHISKIALIGAIALGMGMPSVAEAGLKRKATKIIKSLKPKEIFTPRGMPSEMAPATWESNLSQTSPVTNKNGLSCQTLYLDSSKKDSLSSKVILPGNTTANSPVVKSVTGTVKLGDGANVKIRQIVDSDIMYPGTTIYSPAHTAAPSLSIPPLNHTQVIFGLLRPNYQEWLTGEEGDSFAYLYKGSVIDYSRYTDFYLTMVLPSRTVGENDAPLPAMGDNAGIAILEVCVGPK